MKPLVLAIDDDLFYLNDVKEKLKKYYRGPDDFFERANSHEISEATFVLVDFDYKISNALDLGLARFIREEGFAGCLAIWSLFSEFSSEQQALIERDYDLCLCKEGFSVDHLILKPMNDPQYQSRKVALEY